MFSYLTSFIFYTTLSLGALFFVMIQFISRAGWSVVVRRIPELLMKNLSIMALFFIPILFGIHELYHWSHKDKVATDHILQGKVAYLNEPFFILRAVLFFAVWIWLAHKFYKGSIAQDESGDARHTLSLQKAATYGIVIYALTQTFGFVDWVMSLTPHWYSTIFGVYMFAGSCVVSLSVISLLYLLLKRYGFLTNIVTVEHYHDLGKLAYGFNIFWSYIAFSQYFLIWYANIPEETVFYAQHFLGSWNTVAMFLAVGHFGIPFIFFMSRHAKRNLKFHAIMTTWLVFIHFVDMYWIIMPIAYPKGIHVSFLDITCFIGIGGIYLGVLFKGLKKVALIPKKDPRLSESISFENY